MQSAAVKSNVWDSSSGAPSPKKRRRRSVAAILREAYAIHLPDPLTQRAVRRILR
jgi:hypothetical protein